jgi:hypothetical protein
VTRFVIKLGEKCITCGNAVNVERVEGDGEGIPDFIQFPKGTHFGILQDEERIILILCCSIQCVDILKRESAREARCVS